MIRRDPGIVGGKRLDVIQLQRKTDGTMHRGSIILLFSVTQL